MREPRSRFDMAHDERLAPVVRPDSSPGSELEAVKERS